MEITIKGKSEEIAELIKALQKTCFAEASSLFSDLEDELVTSTQSLEGNEIIKEEYKQS